MKPISVLITGASTGIGFATAVDLAHDGHQVFAGVRRKEDGERLQKECAEIIPVIMDVTKEDQILAAKETISKLRNQDRFYLVNNAGTAVSGPVEAVPMEDYRKQFEVNFFGLVAVTQTFLPWVRETKGRIINLSSIAGRFASPFMGPYAASKFAVEGLTDSLRRELMPFNVKVILVEPGPIETPIWEKGFNSSVENKSRMNKEILSIYAKYVQMFEAEIRQAVATADPVDYVVDTIKMALFSINPRHRYLVGRQANIGGLISQLVPSKAVDIVIRKRFMQLK